MSNELGVGGPGAGIFPAQNRYLVRFTEAAAAGDVVQFDFNNVATGLTALPGGDAGSAILNTVRQPDASAAGARTLGAFWFGIAEAAQAAGSDGHVHIRGVLACNVPAACVAGSTMVPQVSDQLLITTGSTGSKIIAIGLEADTANIALCVFNGVEGFGSDTA